MAGKTYRLEIVTPERLVFSGAVVSVTAPGELGYFGVLANHAPMIVALGEGRVTVRDESESVREIQISGGFFEVVDNRAVILADSAEVDEVEASPSVTEPVPGPAE